MTTKSSLLIAFISTAMTAGVALADPTPKAVAGLEHFVGAWKLTGTLTMGKQKAPVAGTITCARTSGGAAVACTLHATGIPGAPPMEESDLFAYEPNTDKLHWFAANNVGETHDHVAKQTTGDKLEFTYTGTAEGKPLVETIAMTFGKGGTTLAVTSETSVGGAVQAVLAFEAKK